MTPRITLPAACLAQLGSLQDDDPPVMWGGPMRAAGKTTMMYDFTHPLCCAGAPMGRILVTQSAPALLRVLARHVGQSGEQLAWCWVSWGVWMLITVRDGEVVDDPPGWLFAADVIAATDGCTHETVIPTLTPDMSPMRALAECFVWLARVERYEQAKLGADTSSVPEWRVSEVAP